jgi:hypothetical protein
MEMKKLLESLQECGMDMPPAPMDRGNPVSMNVSLNASGKEHVEDLINMMKNAGMAGASEVKPDMMPMRHDMEKFRDIVDGPKMKLPAPEAAEEEIEEYENEPEEEYGDISQAIPDGDDLHRSKKSYPNANGGDNPMALEDEIRAQLEAALAEKKAKPDFLDVDKDGDKKEPMKKAIKDKKAKK